jgi:hypothetical protein
MGTKKNPAPNDCYARAALDEPLFTLLARDPTAPLLVLLWAAVRGYKDEDETAKIDEAAECAAEMARWRHKHRAPFLGYDRLVNQREEERFFACLQAIGEQLGYRLHFRQLSERRSKRPFSDDETVKLLAVAAKLAHLYFPADMVELVGYLTGHEKDVAGSAIVFLDHCLRDTKIAPATTKKEGAS